jgi:BlaI family penicillinase repressor
MPKPPAEVHLSDLQLAVMRVLWARGTAATAEVAAALEVERPLAHTTVATLLTRLEKRGLVAAQRDGRQLVYRATVTEPQVRRSMVAALVATLFEGDAEALVSHLVRESELDASDLERVKALLKEHDRG